MSETGFVSAAWKSAIRPDGVGASYKMHAVV